jgi:hypothetical protein
MSQKKPSSGTSGSSSSDSKSEYYDTESGDKIKDLTNNDRDSEASDYQEHLLTDRENAKKAVHIKNKTMELVQKPIEISAETP